MAANVGLAKQIDDVSDAAARKRIALNPVGQRLEHKFDRGRCTHWVNAESRCEVLDDCRACGVVENTVDLQGTLQCVYSGKRLYRADPAAELGLN